MDPEREVVQNNPTNSSAVANESEQGTDSEGTATLTAPGYQLGAAGAAGVTPPAGNQGAALWNGTVTASTLNVRRGPTAQDTQVRQISRNDTVQVYEVQDGWCRISAGSDAETVEWVSGTYIQRVGQQETGATDGEIPRADLTGNGGNRAHNRWEDDGEDTTYAAEFDETIDEVMVNFFGEGMTRAAVMAEIDQLTTDGKVEEADAMRRKMFLATQHAVVDVLDVENNQMYQPGGGKTYCNIYAYDFVTAMGAYIPRVWWNSAALAKIQRGEAVTAAYGDTVYEMNANALTAWMPEFGVGFGWRKVTDMDAAQQEANSGKIAVILAANARASRSGHISVILSETEQEQKSREEGALPLSSQAGSNNHERHRPSSAWWANSSHKDGAAWVYDGEINSPIMTPEQTGVLGSNETTEGSNESGESSNETSELTKNGSEGLKDTSVGLKDQIKKGETLTAENYLSAIQQLEELAAGEGYSHVQTLSALRKLYYNSGNWNRAIAGAAETGIPASWATLESKPIREAVANSQVVNINGTSVDVGHMLTGLDSTNHNTPFSLRKAGIPIFSFRDNKEFTTFVGDIGSAVEAYIDQRMAIEYLNLIDYNEEQLNTHYDNLAGDVDMAGNADSYAMDFDPSISFSQNLIRYTSGETRGDNKRYTKFAEGIGLGAYENGEFANYSDEWKESLAMEISSFAQAYQMKDGALNGIIHWAGTVHFDKVSRWMTDIFIKKLKEGVQSEVGNE